MSSIESLKEQARRHEQKEEWQKARDLYVRAISRLEKEDQPDIGLYNRVGDILIKLGDFEEAVQNFDRAADLYLEAELPNNAIAVCKKVVRHLPHRSEVHLRMGQIRAAQGFLVDARECFLTYAARMEDVGDTEEALRALVEFAELAPDDTEIRMAVGTQLLKHEQTEEALEQFAAAYGTLMARDDEAGAEPFKERILELDPEADLEALASAASGPEHFAFESTALTGEEGGDAVFEAEFGEIVSHPEDATATDLSDSDTDHTSQDALDDAEMAFGSEEEGAGEPVEGDFGEILAHGDDDPGMEEEEDDDAADEDEPLPFISLEEDDDQDVEVQVDPEPLPLLSDPLEDEPPEDEAPEGGAPEDEVPEGSAPPLEDEEVAVDSTRAMESAVEERDPGEEGEVAEEDDVVGETPREEWEALRARWHAGMADAELPQKLVELAFKLDDQEILLESYLLLAGALEEEGEVERARAVARQILALDPEHGDGRTLLERLDTPGDEEGGEVTPGEDEAGAGDYVDLNMLIFGEDEGEKTTRFQVAYEEPTGDEDADFAKLLDQFKSKVAENVDVSDVKAHHDLGTAYKEMGLLDEAVAEFQLALRASRNHLPTYELLGQTFMEKGEHMAAVRVMERALKLPSDVEDDLIGIYYYLAQAHEALGHDDDAVEFYDRVFALDINFRDVTSRLRELR